MLRRSWIAPVLLLLVGCLSAACSSPETATSPGLAVKEFYTRLNDGDYGGAKSLYDSTTRKLLDDPEMGTDAGFVTWAQEETKRGKIERIDVRSQEETADRATVECELLYSDGTTATRTVTVTLEGGVWRLGVVG